MEDQQTSISLESLSYRWLVNYTPSLDESDEANSFIEMDPRLPPSKRFNPIFWNLNPQEFKFDLQTPLQTLVPADELFAEGAVLPLHDSSDSVFSAMDGTHEVARLSQTKQKRCCSMSKRLFCRYFVGLFSHCCRGLSSRVEDESAKTKSEEWSRGSCDSESSIHEAVLHCKRSSGKRLHGGDSYI